MLERAPRPPKQQLQLPTHPAGHQTNPDHQTVRFILTADFSNLHSVAPTKTDRLLTRLRMTILDRLHPPRPDGLSAMLLVLLIIAPVTLAHASPPIRPGSPVSMTRLISMMSWLS